MRKGESRTMRDRWNLKTMSKRIGALGMAGIVLAGSFGMPVKAGAPQVQVDESVYVNMDYYGAINDISIVKGCFLNGNTQIEDYGNYDEVINMTNRVEAVQADDKLTWDLSGEDDSKFYYECKSAALKEKLPWTIDVTYKLNGVEQFGEKLAGANGTVTIAIKAIPNKEADEYYRNNMILMCGTGVDMENTLSINAPGAQLQSFGTMKGVIFMALPGEESEFQIDIGTESFESMGVFFMMVPATLSSLEMVNDIRDVRDTAEDSLDAISDATDAILDDIVAMKDNMQTTQDGLKAAQEAKSIYDENRGSMKADADAAISSIESMASYLEVINNELEVQEDDYTEVMERIDAINKTINGMRDYYDDMDDTLDDLEHNLTDIKKIYKGTVTEQGLIDLAYLLEGRQISNLSNDGLFQNRSEDVKKLEQGIVYYNSQVPGAAQINPTPSSTGEIGLANLLKLYMANLKKVGEDPAVDALVNSHDLLDRSEDILAKIDSVLAQTDSLSNFATGEGKEDMDQLIEQMEELINMTNVTLLTTASAMKTMRYTLDTMEPSLDAAVDSTLNGMIGLLGNGIDMTDSMGLVKDAKDIMKDAIDDEIDKLEDDSNVLNLDVTQAFPSFTSDKNPAPTSIQIIMRTAEISIDDDNSTIVDLETDPVDLGVWGRLKAIFVQIWEAITGIFQ